MKLLIWLWNPWKQYEKTRHNVWFIFLDKFAIENDFSEFKLETKFKWEISEWRIDWNKTILLKPTTYMNLSWEKILKESKFEFDMIIDMKFQTGFYENLVKKI